MTRTSRDFPHKILLPKMRNQWETTKWCEEQFGKRWSVVDNRQGTWCVFWRERACPGCYEWYFQNETDFINFVLKWS